MAAYANPARAIRNTYKYVHPIRGHPSDPAIARQKKHEIAYEFWFVLPNRTFACVINIFL
jgi:hypothetical protein